MSTNLQASKRSQLPFTIPVPSMLTNIVNWIGTHLADTIKTQVGTLDLDYFFDQVYGSKFVIDLSIPSPRVLLQKLGIQNFELNKKEIVGVLAIIDFVLKARNQDTTYTTLEDFHEDQFSIFGTLYALLEEAIKLGTKTPLNYSPKSDIVGMTDSRQTKISQQSTKGYNSSPPTILDPPDVTRYHQSDTTTSAQQNTDNLRSLNRKLQDLSACTPQNLTSQSGMSLKSRLSSQ